MPMMPNPFAGMQDLVTDNTSPNVDEALESRIKDPLWFLARQWQSGEFEAENGGRVAQMNIGMTVYPVDALTRGGQKKAPLSPDTPLDYAVEKEEDDGTSPAWKAEALEYGFSVSAGAWKTDAAEYHGRRLDWHHFDLGKRPKQPPGGESKTVRAVPTGLAYHGMPHPRWWRFEERTTFIEANDDPEPSILSMLLAEFLYADSNNWYIVPLEQAVGSLRRIDQVHVIDSFGTAQPVGPVSDDAGGAWQVFTLDDGKGAGGDGDVLFAPNVGTTVVNGEHLEEVSFLRDEDSNLVWAVERYYYDDAAGRRVNRDDEVRREVAPGDGAAPPAEDENAAPAYRLMSSIARNWVPYVPRLVPGQGRSGAQTYLRRARSDETASRQDPQFKSRIVAESWKLLEEEVPRTGVKIERLWRFVRGSDGAAHFWVGRRKSPGIRERTANLRYDYLDET